ncbi:MAG: YceI family protein, partial [Dehalococcoidia bacterium]
RFDGSAITEVRVEADLRNLQSDDSRRDGALRRQALETDRYPTASFVLTEPIRLDAVPAENQPLAATAVGDLTIHGATRNVSIDLEGQLANGFVVVAGSLDIRFADYGIAQPRSLAVLSVEDRGTLELQLIFEKAASRG